MFSLSVKHGEVTQRDMHACLYKYFVLYEHDFMAAKKKCTTKKKLTRRMNRICIYLRCVHRIRTVWN